jgi:hypothetical protein
MHTKTIAMVLAGVTAAALAACVETAAAPDDDGAEDVGEAAARESSVGPLPHGRATRTLAQRPDVVLARKGAPRR